MKKPFKSSDLASVEKYELCKGQMLRKFVSEFRKNSDAKTALKEAQRVIEKWASSGRIVNKYQITGLKGELIYFYRSFQEQKLTAEMAIGYKADFRGKILGQPAAIDVTTNPVYKEKKEEFESIRGRLQNGWDYYVGLVDTRRTESEILPLLLPICKDGNVGFFVLVYDDQGPSSQNLWGESSDLQHIIRFNPACGGDESDAIEETGLSYNYILGKPSNVIADVREYWVMDGEPTPKDEASISRDIAEYFDDIALFFRKLSGLMISAIVDTEQITRWKDDWEWVTKQYWVHPHSYVRKKLGGIGEIMDYNIAGHVQDFF